MVSRVVNGGSSQAKRGWSQLIFNRFSHQKIWCPNQSELEKPIETTNEWGILSHSEFVSIDQRVNAGLREFHFVQFDEGIHVPALDLFLLSICY